MQCFFSYSITACLERSSRGNDHKQLDNIGIDEIYEKIENVRSTPLRNSLTPLVSSFPSSCLGTQANKLLLAEEAELPGPGFPSWSLGTRRGNGLTKWCSRQFTRKECVETLAKLASKDIIAEKNMRYFFPVNLLRKWVYLKHPLRQVREEI